MADRDVCKDHSGICVQQANTSEWVESIDKKMDDMMDELSKFKGMTQAVGAVIVLIQLGAVLYNAFGK
jgi:hypothetical protein